MFHTHKKSSCDTCETVSSGSLPWHLCFCQVSGSYIWTWGPSSVNTNVTALRNNCSDPIDKKEEWDRKIRCSSFILLLSLATMLFSLSMKIMLVLTLKSMVFWGVEFCLGNFWKCALIELKNFFFMSQPFLYCRSKE